MSNNKRYYLIDCIRGLALISMIVYHAVWDLVYLFGVDMPWYESDMAVIWQQSICWTFILLSGFCWDFGGRKLQRAVKILVCSGIISLVTLIFMPESKILFGILTLIGTGMLLMIPLDKLYKRINPYIGMLIMLFLFLFTKEINSGKVGFHNIGTLKLSDDLYSNMFTAYLGFPSVSFESMDYFPILPWIFLYQTGYFLYRIFVMNTWLEKLPGITFKPIEWLGKNSLLVYMLHQPVVFGGLWLVFL